MRAEYVLLSLKNVRRRGIRSWLTMLGIFIGIAAVVSLISLSQGLAEAITGQFSALSVDTLIVQGVNTGFGPPGSTAVRKMTSHDLDLIEGVSGVKLAIPRLIHAAEVKFNDVAGFAFVASIPEDQDKIDEVYDSLNLEAEDGRLLKEGDSGVVMLGNDFKHTKLYGKEIKLGSKLQINDQEFRVVGFLKRSGTLSFNRAIFMMEDDMRSLFSIPNDEIDFIVVKVGDKSETESVAELIKEKLRKDRDLDVGKEDFEVQTPLQALSVVKTILMVINVVVVGIALISLLIGGIGIANTMFTSVIERTKEIGVMKAIGARNSDVLAIFVIEAGLLGLVGGAVGAVLGVGFAFGVAHSANSFFGNELFKVTISLPLVAAAMSFALLIGIISGIWPALQAAKLNPVEALRS